MRKNIIIKALVLGSIGCAFTITGMAANGHGQGYADSTTEVNGAKHEAVRSNWMDRTDITVGAQSKMGAQVSVETLQPLYKAASVKVDKKIRLVISLVVMEDFGIRTIQLQKKVNNGIDLRNIMILSHWGLLPMLG